MAIKDFEKKFVLFFHTFELNSKFIFKNEIETIIKINSTETNLKELGYYCKML